MKKLLTLTVALMMAFSVNFAQDYAPKAGAMGLLFQFEGLSFLGAGNYNGGIGAKLFLNKNMAIRGGLVFTSISETDPANPPLGMSGTDGEQSVSRFGINAAIELHLATGRVNPYIGGGVSFETVSTEEKSTEVGNPPPLQTTIKNNMSGVLGYNAGTAIIVGVFAGAEFFLWEQVSLSAEYQIGLTSLSQADEEMSVPPLTLTTKGGSRTSIGIRSQGFFTLAFYF